MANYTLEDGAEDYLYARIQYLDNYFTSSNYHAIVIERGTSGVSEGDVCNSNVLSNMDLVAYYTTQDHATTSYSLYFRVPMSDSGGDINFYPDTYYSTTAWAVVDSDDRMYKIGSSSNRTEPEVTSQQLPTPEVTSTTEYANSIYVNIDYVSEADDYFAWVEEVGFFSNTSSNVTVTGLDPSTTYKIYLWLEGDGYKDSEDIYIYRTTDSLPKLSDPYATSITSTTTSITVDMASVSGADYYRLEAWRGAIREGYEISGYSTVTVTDLVPHVPYDLVWCATGSGYEDSDDITATKWTEDLGHLDTPEIYYTSTTDSSVSVYIHSVTNASYYNYRLEYSNGTYISQVNTSSLSHTFTGLSANTSYKVGVQAQATNYVSSDVSVKYFTTNPTTLIAPTGLRAYSVSEGGASLTWDSVSGASGYTLKAVGMLGTVTINTSWTNGTFSAGSLGYGYDYYFSVKANSPNGDAYDSTYSSTVSEITLPKKPTITVNNTTTSSISIKVNGLEGNYGEAFVYIYNNGGTTPLTNRTVSWNGSIVTFTGLATATDYDFRAVSQVTVSSVQYQSNSTATLNATTENRPANFAGWSTNVSSGATLNLLATDWNTFTDKVNEFRIYLGLGSTSFTTVGSGNDFLATYFNQARVGILGTNYNSGTYTLPVTKSRGDKVYASDLNALVDCLNSIT